MKIINTLIITTFVTTFGCATIFSGSTRTVEFKRPAGTDIYIDGRNVGTTPYKSKLDNSKSYTVQFKKGERQSKVYMLHRSTSTAWVICDILFGGLIGIIVDASTGAWHYLDNSELEDALNKKKPKN